ncbi:hypothetical protein [Streptomyces sp. NPDC002088]|uniref:hypothetical protein n=1 Tax=Streptomyces sp. NPDC002088 TaxID=3154665 RepID=UPI00332C2347
MYENFLREYPPDNAPSAVAARDERLAMLDGYTELLQVGAGSSFGSGILYVHTPDEAEEVAQLILEAFPEFRGRIAPVAQDWLGRQYAVDLVRSTANEAAFLLFEVGSGEAFEIDCGLPELLDAEFIEDPDTFLGADLYAEWTAEHAVPVPPRRCVGFKAPLFLGGHGEVSNLEDSDRSVYWSLMGQLRAAAQG